MAQAEAHTIPHPPAKPIVGHALSLDPNAPVGSLLDFAKQLGPIFQLNIMGSPLVFVSGAKFVKELCDEKRFDKAVRGPLARVRAIGGDGLFTAKTSEPNWTKAHNILLAPFGGRAMQAYHPAMVDIAEQLCLKWARLNADEDIDVVHDMTALTLDTIGLCGFDYRFNSFYRRDYNPFVEALVRSLETIMMQRGLPLENMMMRGRLATLNDDVAFMNKMVDDLVSARREQMGDADAKKDLLNAMLTGVDRATGTQLDDVNIRYQINTFLIAGHETTSGLLSYTLYALLKHPEILQKAYDEVDRVFGPDPSIRPTYQQVTQLSYINQIMKESLRLYPPAPAFSVYPYNEEVICGYKLRKGITVNILVGALHRDPEVWGPRADIFDPENFSPAAESARPAWAWKPFGNGQRACIGRGFAMHEAALALGMILQRYKLIDHQRYQMKLKETLTIKPDGFKIKVKPREARDRANAPPAATASAAAPRVETAAPATRPTHNTPLSVLYGSNLGTAEEFAHRLAETAEINGFATQLGALDQNIGAPPKDTGLVIFCSSYNGAPPDNATKFVNWLENEAAPDAFAGVRYTVFGCGNREWNATYQSVPRMIDERIAELGGVRIAQRGEGDARDDLDGQYEDWFAALRPKAAEAFGLQASLDRETRTQPLYNVEPASPQGSNPAVNSAGAKVAHVLENRELLTAPDRSTRHIEIALPEGATYRAGDHLAVVPRNDATLVAAIAKRLGHSPDDVVRLRGAEGRRALLPLDEPVSVGKLLSDYVELQQVATRKQIQTMAEHTRCPVTRPKLEVLSGETEEAAAAYRAEVLAMRKSVYDLLEEFPACELPLSAYLEMTPLLQPRYYSISSSPKADPQRCTVTVGVVEGPARSGRGVFKGVCSNYLSGRKAEDTIFAAVRETKAGFRLPEDTKVPLVMIGPGTGLAPFRGFLQERAALEKEGATLGPAMLFFGCRRPDQDFLYADELKAYAADGIVELHTAFSRMDGQPKTYVQDLVRAQQDRVWQLIEAGAIVYICGDGGKMEPDVKRALVEIYCARRNATPEAGEAWINEMGASNRYVLDVWAGG
ncbi:MAG: cytochrome P450 [Rhodoblastus sp.]|nr:cytochrome P450 [Rhodoblastus sp.]